MTKISFVNAVGSLMYVMICTQLDIAYAMGLVSRYQLDPSPLQWSVAKRIFKYLKGITHYFLSYRRIDFVLIGYTNAYCMIWSITNLLLPTFSC